MNSRTIKALLAHRFASHMCSVFQSKKFPPVSPELSVLFTSRDMGSTAPHSVTTYSCAELLAKLRMHTHSFTDEKFPPLATNSKGLTGFDTSTSLFRE